MGYLEKSGLKMLGFTPPNTCPMCATKHNEDMPHNQQSLTYMYKFYDENGHFPSWADAMAHCSEEVKKVWTEALTEKGIDVNKHDETGMMSIEIKTAE